MREKAGEPPGAHLLPVRGAPEPKARRRGLYHPALHALIKEQRRATPRQELAYTAVSNWLHALRGPVLKVPLRERALEIFGRREYTAEFPEPEKCLDHKGFGGPLFEKRADFYDLIRAFPTDPPLLNARFSEFSPVAQSTSLSDGDLLLVVENSATYTSLVRRLRELEHHHRIGCVAWGVGRSFTASVRTISDHHGADGQGRARFREIRYFGDLDVSGLEIPLKARDAAADLGLRVVPTPVLYRDLVTMGTPLPGKERSRTREEAETLANWLGGGHHFEPVVDVLMKGERWAQEGVGLRHLSTTSDWLTDMR
ncbi:hypothetical protein OYE22_06675 [Streptomyces sp. 71268]|uniref:hypothetical protein n=1 Tax=Streptomyces sp. 71268 TaxID=3002640 RepID=UPI0023F94A78|nr:hypothetical protein [Streptomyces sp. 71268]WEV24916.1 hypothetical protein OYE22_06675 [Streptomyces sp. 71268]